MTNNNTTKQIFDTALTLFAKKGYSEVSIREIAYHVGIKESSVYNHYNSKKQILDHIYKEFKHCINKHHLTKKEIDKYAQTESAEKLLSRFIIIFPRKEIKLVVNTYKILITQQYVNTYAKELLMKAIVKRIYKSLRYAIERLIYYQKIPAIDSKKFARIILEVFFAKTIDLTHQFYENIDYEKARKEHIESLKFLMNIAVKEN